MRVIIIDVAGNSEFSLIKQPGKESNHFGQNNFSKGKTYKVLLYADSKLVLWQEIVY